MIDYDFPLYRPPAEADNIIVQATFGCSYNHCSFCSMYKSKNYTVRPIAEVFTEIDTLALQQPHARRVFLADGDALALPTEYLVELLQYLQKAFVKLSRVSLYATAQNLLAKTQSELNELATLKLSLLYFGIETGNETVLKKIHKGVNASEMKTALDKALKAGIKTSVTVILGMGGRRYSDEHIRDTAKLINETEVTYLSTLQLGLQEDVKEKFYKAFDGDFTHLNDSEILKEQLTFLEQLKPKNKVIFRSNHASNALALAGTLPKDSARLLKELTLALRMGDAALRPAYMRGF